MLVHKQMHQTTSIWQAQRCLVTVNTLSISFSWDGRVGKVLTNTHPTAVLTLPSVCVLFCEGRYLAWHCFAEELLVRQYFPLLAWWWGDIFLRHTALWGRRDRRGWTTTKFHPFCVCGVCMNEFTLSYLSPGNLIPVRQLNRLTVFLTELWLSSDIHLPSICSRERSLWLIDFIDNYFWLNDLMTVWKTDWWPDKVTCYCWYGLSCVHRERAMTALTQTSEQL